ncbi:putative receptor-like protein kinase [Acorus gramineus]|uniref:Receptor-like protein kinase n=1 Tax=Acorus gramineus TaxID=55184 RepID=A0AAV8ZZI2_ACOGR|nr:putative receptor-like protein kinase [Acorus gramineus]
MEQVQLQLQFKVAALVFFSILPFKSSSPYTPPDPYYLLNCGSSAPSTNPSSDDNRAFLPDTQVSPPTGKHISIGDTTSSTLYAAARVFTDTSSYEFDINSTKTHTVRLHFLPLTTAKYDLSAAVFNVSANDEFNLLSNFSATNTTTRVKKEYFINVGAEKIRICFTPINELAFVSAIEVFSIPDDILPSSKPPVVWPSELNFSVSNQALETLYRINVGGSLVTPSNDTMWRTWIPDDHYLASGDKSNLNAPANSINYDLGGLTKEIAPNSVYDTCRNMSSQNSNITWEFEASGHATHLVRLHFCDITLSTLYELSFNVYINDEIAFEDIVPGVLVGRLASPFYKDCTADSRRLSSGGKWLIRVSIGPPTKMSWSMSGGILNGLEIFKLVPGSVQHKHNKKPRLIVPCIVVGGGFALLSAALLLFLLYRRRNRFKSEESTTLAANADVSQSTVWSIATNMNLDLHISLSQIKSATKNFDESLVIGAGGFGKVYKGVLKNGGGTRTRVAIKRASQRSRQGFPEFETEIHVLSGIRHRHLVSLIGYCQERSEMILVYEFMSKGTLRDHLYNSDLPSLSWKQRLEICIGSARGLHYLHSGLAHPIIHRDVKSSNILLDDDFTGKVSDFGLSRVVGRSGESHVSTGVKGSFGYFDPEYVRTQQLTTKSDVYSFGVVLLEALCARSVIGKDLPSEEVNLADWAMSWHKQGLLQQTIDPRLVGEINPNSLRVFGQVTEKCLEEYGADRPTMTDVVWNLEYALQLQETEMAREPYEDSTSCATELPLPPVIGRWPSISNVVTINSSVDRDTESESTASRVFSQFMTSEGR